MFHGAAGHVSNSCGSACRAVVIMAERNKSDMDADVQAALKGYRIRWQTREGAPYSAADLAKVSASAASTVILMRPDNSRVAFKDSDSAAVRRRRFHQVSQGALPKFGPSLHGDGKVSLPTCCLYC